MKLKRMLETFYRLPIGYLFSLVAQILSNLKKPRMIYGLRDPATKNFRKFTRVSDSSVILGKSNLAIGDFVWVGHYSILDASEGLNIEEGCQLAAWVGIYTHSSHTAIRLYGKDYVNIPSQERAGYVRGAVKIGAYSFVGAGAVILPGVTIGRGCLISAGAMVNKDIPDYSIVVGSPGKIVGSTKKMDQKFLTTCHDPDQFEHTYYDADVFQQIMADIDYPGAKMQVEEGK